MTTKRKHDRWIWRLLAPPTQTAGMKRKEDIPALIGGLVILAVITVLYFAAVLYL